MFPNTIKPKKVMLSTSKKIESDPDLPKASEMEADFAAGNFDAVLKAWPELQNVSLESMKLVVRSLMELQTMLDLNCALRNTRAMNQVLAIVAPKDSGVAL